MNEATIHFGTIFMAFFAIMNPIANAPLFLGLTSDLDARTRRGIAISPLAIPVLEGPGTIATAMRFAADSTVAEITRVIGVEMLIVGVRGAVAASGGE